MEGDNSQVEMKLSSDMDEEAGGNGVGARLNHNSNHKPFVAQKLGRTPKNLCFMAAGIFLLFIIGKKGFKRGFLNWSHPETLCSASIVPSEGEAVREMGSPPMMDWDDVKKLLAQKLTASKLDSAFIEFTLSDHVAGSPGDEDLGNKVLNRFKEYGLKSWTDEHFVTVHDLPASNINRIVFKNSAEERLVGFLSYSATGSVKGAVLYAYYGQENDFRTLRDRNIDLSGRVVIVRAGRISFAEKVANAAKMNASAVLIYPDGDDYSFDENIQLFGHVHMGSGDPYTPGFPSFNHTQFPPVQSSGLPKILAQTITRRMATNIFRQLGGQTLPEGWKGFHKLGDVNDSIVVEVNNILTQKKIINVFGVIKGFVDADRYVVVGAQRDAWGPGFAASTVGTSILLELARSISEMVKNDGFKPRRSIVFASFTGGEYGSVGATEWLEGYLSSLGTKAFSYINLDGIVTGQKLFKVAASPLMHTLIERTLREVNTQLFLGFTIMLEPLKMDSAAYPFLAFSGIPSISFRFTSDNPDYMYLNTKHDTREKLNFVTDRRVPQLAEQGGRFAGHIVLRLIHDHLLQMDLMKYDKIIRSQVSQINGKHPAVLFSPHENLTVQWLISASGSFSRASRKMANDVQNSDLDDVEMCRIINDYLMSVERNFLSPYVSPRDSPFRHILLGSGPHTLKALSSHLDALRASTPEADGDLFRNQFALATWTLQGCANSLAGDIWALDNEI
uniref:Transferrin receptor protein 1 n=1 Tax=Gouania willdenowi TaxID=441366 RepID=A0A8C5GRA9_GOUWI